MLVVLKNRIFYFSISICLIKFFGSCTSFVEVDPPYTSFNSDNLFNDDVTATSAITAVYTQWSKSNIELYLSAGELSNLDFLSGLSSDELTLYSTGNQNLFSFFTNSLLAVSAPTFWSYMYYYIYEANTAIIKISDNTKLSKDVQQQLLGEAKFIRAFCYFNLINLYGKVPLVLTSDPYQSGSIGRTSLDLIYTQIINDLIDAKGLLSENFLNSDLKTQSLERVRPTKWAAASLLSKVYLYNSNYKKAEEEANFVINKTDLFGLDSLKNTFIKNSAEAIFQLQAVKKDPGNTGEGQTFIFSSAGPDDNYHPVYLSKQLLTSFESGDFRRKIWVDSVLTNDGSVFYYPFKYKSGRESQYGEIDEYLIVFRLGELYLIRSEARANSGDLDGAKADLNLIRARAGLGNLTTSTSTELLDQIFHERQVELFTEWGNRWFDLKRSGKIDQVMPSITQEKGGTWRSSAQYYPIPNPELSANPQLEQNEGY